MSMSHLYRLWVIQVCTKHHKYARHEVRHLIRERKYTRTEADDSSVTTLQFINVRRVSCSATFWQPRLAQPLELTLSHRQTNRSHIKKMIHARIKPFTPLEWLPCMLVQVKVKCIYIVPSRKTSKALRHGSHSVTSNYTDACLYLVSVHQMAPPQTEVANI